MGGRDGFTRGILVVLSHAKIPWFLVGWDYINCPNYIGIIRENHDKDPY